MARKTVAQARAHKQAEINFSSTPADAALIRQIVDRGLRLAKDAGCPRDRLEMQMDLTATHLNGCPLDLPKLLAADDFNLSHDVFGIERHLDRDTGSLTGFFRPRCAAKEAA